MDIQEDWINGASFLLEKNFTWTIFINIYRLNNIEILWV